MKRVFVDANVFMRFFTRDDKGRYERAARLFGEAREGTVELICGPPVLFEVAWTLRAAYKVSKQKVAEVLSAILAQPGLHVADAGLVEAAIVRSAQSGVEFADAYIAVSSESLAADAIATFNETDFRKLKSPLHPF
jgi:predicted nucleic acid-binding protein